MDALQAPQASSQAQMPLERHEHHVESETAQFSIVCPASQSTVGDIWRELKCGHRPGPDPRARDAQGRVTLRAWLADRLAKLTHEQKYALLAVAVSADPPCITGLSATLELVDVDLNAYLQTSEGVFTLPALVLCNGGNDNAGCDFATDVVQTLLALRSAGADLTLPAVRVDGRIRSTLAHLVVANEHGVEVLNFLSSIGADMDVRDNLGATPLRDACYAGNLLLVQTLQQCGAALDGDGLLYAASRKGRPELVKYLLQSGLDVNDAIGGQTSLQAASQHGHLEVVQLLLSHGADMDRVDSGSRSAFSLAFRSGHASVVSYLRNCGAREHPGHGRRTPHMAETAGFKIGSSLPQPKPEKNRSRRKRSTPMRERAERVGVLDRYKDTPPELRARADNGSPSAKKELNALHKYNHQVVDRAEVAAAPIQTEHLHRQGANALSHRKRKLEKSFAASDGTDV